MILISMSKAYIPFEYSFMYTMSKEMYIIQIETSDNGKTIC